jgi:hypothetical protein
MCTALTKAPCPPASCPRLDLETFQRRPGKGARVPVRLGQAHPWIGLWDRHTGQLGPYQANRRGGQPWEKLCGRERLRSRPEGLGHVAVCDAKHRMPQGSGVDLHGHAVRAARVKTMHIQSFLQSEQQPFDLPPPGIAVQRVGDRQPAGLQDIRQPRADLAPLAPPTAGAAWAYPGFPCSPRGCRPLCPLPQPSSRGHIPTASSAVRSVDTAPPHCG